MQSRFVILSALAAVVSATHPLALPKLKRDLEVRQTVDVSDLSPSCTSAVLSLATALPTPPPSLMEAALEGDLDEYLASPCDASIPGSLSSDIQVYATSVQKWYSSHSSEVSSVLGVCTDLVSMIGGSFSDTIPMCSTTAGSASSSASASRTASGSASKSPSSNSASQTKTVTETATESVATTMTTSAAQSGSQTTTGAAASTTTDAGGLGSAKSASAFAAVAAGAFALFAL